MFESVLHSPTFVPTLRRASLVALLGALATTVACQSDAKPEWARPYPPGQAVETLNVQVTRDETRLTLTNTSARDFGPATLWINKSFAKPIDGFAIGQTLNLDLATFTNQFGDRFRAGGFFATDRPHDVVLAEIEEGDTGERYGFIVVRGEAE
jgi:hypothetical protein